MKITALSLLLVLTWVAGYSAGPLRKTSGVKLIVPDSYHGDIYICEDEAHGIDWGNGNIEIPNDGVVFVRNYRALATLKLDSFISEYKNGKLIKNSFSVADVSGPRLLWPIIEIDHNVLYFVIGTFGEKTALESAKMKRWKEVVARIEAIRTERNARNEPREPAKAR